MARAFGWSIAEIDGLYFEDALGYVEESEAIERREYKMLAAIAAYPYMKEDAQKSFWASLEKKSKPKKKVRVGFSPERAKRAKEIEEAMKNGV